VWGDFLHGGDFVIRTTEDLSRWPVGERSSWGGRDYHNGGDYLPLKNVSPRRIFYGGDNSVTPAVCIDTSVAGGLGTGSWIGWFGLARVRG